MHKKKNNGRRNGGNHQVKKNPAKCAKTSKKVNTKGEAKNVEAKKFKFQEVKKCYRE